MKLKTAGNLFKTAASNWVDDKASRLGAAIAYYTVFAIPPLLIIAIFVASLFFSEHQVRTELFGQIKGMLGERSAQFLQDTLIAFSEHKAGVIATIVAIGALILTSTGLFLELQSALNSIWGVEQKPGQGIQGFMVNRLLSFSMVIGIGFLLLVSLVVSTVISALSKYMAGTIPGSETLWVVINLLVSLGVITLLFAMVFKVLPDVKIAWSDVWVGAAFTALLFTIGKFALGMYLGNNSAVSAYGAAGSLVLLLLWVYYSAQILFFGAEITQAYASKCGSEPVPKEHARWVDCPPEANKSLRSREAQAKRHSTTLAI